MTSCIVHAFLLPVLVVLCLETWVGDASWLTCETKDGDCQENCTTATATLRLSGEPQLVRTATQAQTVLKDIAATSSSSTISCDDPKTGLHSSLFYFCCHDDEEIAKIRQALQHDMLWRSFEVDFNNVGCNLDHNGETIYLHALPDDQTKLFGLARQIEATVQAAGVPIYHPRKTMFHMTLARVNHEYPVDYAMFELEGKEFGRVLVCSFEFNGTNVKSLDYENCVSQREESGGRRP